MKKIISLAAVGLLALSIFGCGKKTTKNNTNNQTKNNTTIPTTNKTNKNTTKKTTEKKTTTKEVDKTEFKEVSYNNFIAKVNQLEPTDKFKLLICNGTYEDSPSHYTEISNYKYRLNQNNMYVTSEYDPFDYRFHNVIQSGFIKTVPNESFFKYFFNENGEFKVICEGEYEGDTPISYTFNKYGLITEYALITNDSSNSHYVKFNWYEIDPIRTLERTTKEEYLEIANSYGTITNGYLGAYLTGRTYNYYTTNEQTAAEQPLYFDIEENKYLSCLGGNANFDYGVINALKAKDLAYGDNTFYYKNSDGEIGVLSYVNDEGLYMERYIEYNKYGYIKAYKDYILDDTNYHGGKFTYDFTVDYITDEPSVTITFNSGLGKFNDDSTEYIITTRPGVTLNDIKSTSAYKVPTLENSKISSRDWFTSNSMAYDPTQMILEDISLTYGFISDAYDSPAFTSTFAQAESNSENTITFKVTYVDDAVCGVTFVIGSTFYYMSGDTITLSTPNACNCTFWGAISSVSFGTSTGCYASGNYRLKSFNAIVYMDYPVYSFANLNNLESVTLGSSYPREYSIDDYAFYNASKLSTFTCYVAPKTIGVCAFSKTGFKGIFTNTYLLQCPYIKSHAFSEMQVDLILVPVNVKLVNVMEGNNQLSIEGFFHTSWSPNWNGDNDSKTDYLLYIPAGLTEGGYDLTITNSNNIKKIAFFLAPNAKYNLTINIVAVDTPSDCKLREQSTNTEILSALFNDGVSTLSNYTVSEDKCLFTYEFYSQNPNPAEVTWTLTATMLIE